MWSINRANITFPWHKYIWGKRLEYHLPKQMWKRWEAWGSIGDGLETFPLCSSLSLCVRMHALLLFTQQLRNTASRLVSRLHNRMSFKGSVGQRSVQCVLAFGEARKRFRVSLSKWNDADALGLLVPSVSVPQWALPQPDPECCESLFIKSIPPLWPHSSHANCCLLRPFSSFSFTCAPTHVRARTLTQRCTKL